jgi:ubiquinone/menaquinone biosynthesis C-methylase UbiE
LTALEEGEIVLDLGSGAGVDCFIAARKVGKHGQAIGVDMTPAMVSRARAIARAAGFDNVEFRLGEIEHLPVADGSVDVVLSNCVINLSPDKPQVYREAFRVLRPGGRLAISDVVATRPIPPEVRSDPEVWASCSSGAITPDELRTALRSAGFQQVDVALASEEHPSQSLAPQGSIGVVAASVVATKPLRG